MMYLGDQAVGLATSLPIFSDKMEIETGIYIPNEDINILDNPIYINHHLGTMPDFILVQTFGFIVNNSYDKKYAICLVFQRIDNNYISILTKSLNAGQVTVASNNIWAPIERIIESPYNYISDSYFKIISQGANSYLKKDMPYYYIVGKFKEVTSNAS